MRRKKDDKRVLVSPRDARKKNSRVRNRRQPYTYQKKQHKRSKLTVFLMILALVAFVVGAGIGISLSFNSDNDDGPHWVNVTKEMTSDLNETEPIVFDEEVDRIDYNDTEALNEMNISIGPSY